jgi:1-acyl-sn-glycerol-3-phosphate acyltransferase
MYKHLKLALIVLILIVYLILYLLFSHQVSKIFYILANKLALVKLTNTTIRVHGNTTNFSNNNLLIMSNHYHFNDGNILYDLYYDNNSIETLHTIVKADFFTDPTADQKILHLLSCIQDKFLSSAYFIPYKRGDKADGKKIRNTIVDALSDGKNILVFPEGTSHKNGFPKEFKKGTFEVAVENKLRILPITIKYEKDIGKERGEPVNLLNIFDNVVDVYIHDIIDETDEFYQEKNPEGLKNKVYTIITTPLLV